MFCITNIRSFYYPVGFIVGFVNFSNWNTTMSTRAKPVLSIRGLMLAMKNAWERRRVMGQLGGLDDHMLRDIGITRQDVASVLAEPLFRDPSQKLAERARATRLANRAAAHDLLHDLLMVENALAAAPPALLPRHDVGPRRAA